MGGKHKQAQRTKNNTRPSSSGRSAELLGSSIPTFVGFTTGKDGGFVPVIPGFGGLGIDDIDPNIDTNFQLVLKKMNKKDAVTKHKALQEFIELVNGCELEVLKTVLPFWPRLYCSLAVDAEHRVREASHLAQRAVAVKAKRNLAPYLKQLIGPWFTSQYDSYAPAASAAQQAFQDAFPTSKLPEVIAFCQEEILSYVYENLIHSVPQSTTNKNLSEDEVEARYQRILVASLQGYALYLRKVPPPQIEMALESNKKLITNSKFWKLSKHKSPFIRTAWFSTLGALLQCAPTCLLENEGQRVTTTVLANLDETDPAVLPVVWETALLALFTVQDWWMHINVEKLVLPKLWRVLRDAAQGNATSIYPNLLPLISKFPPGSDANAFYSTFFDNIRLGLNQKSVQQSRSELNSVVTSFTECLQYVILKNQHDQQLCESLIKNQLIITVKWCILDGHFATKTIYSQITNLIHYWYRNRNNIETPLYSYIVQLFWKELTDLCLQILQDNDSNFDKELCNNIHTKIIELLFTLRRNNHNIKLKKQLKVQFSERLTSEYCDNSVDSENSQPLLSSTESGGTKQNADKSFLDELNLLVYKICVFYMNNVPKCINLYLFHYYSLIQEFDSLNLFQYLCDNLNATGVYALYDQVLNGWLIIGEETDTLVDLTFILFKYLKSDEIEMILNTFIQLNNEKVLLRCVAQSLAHPFRHMDIVSTWLKRKEIDQLLENCCTNMIDDNENNNPENIGLLRLACAPDETEGLLISKEALIKIVNIICRPLLNPQEYPITLDACARFAAVLSAFLYSDEYVHIYSDLELLIALFTLNANVKITNETLTEDTLWEINTAWQDAISVLRTKYALESKEILHITNRFAEALKSTITPTVNTELFNKVVQLTIEYITSCCPNSTVGRVTFVLNNILQHFDVTTCVKHFTEICLNAETINGVLVSPDAMIKIDNLYVEKFQNCSKINADIEVDQMIVYCKYTVQLIYKLYEKSDNGDEDNEEENSNNENDDEEKLDSNENNTLPLNILTPDIENDILFHIFTCSVLNTYSKYFKITKQYNAIKTNLPEYEKILTNLLNILNKEMVEQINETLFNKSTTLGYIWPHLYYILHTQYQPKLLTVKAPNVLCTEGLRSATASFTSIGWLHWLCIFANDLKLEQIDLIGKRQVQTLAIVRNVPMSEKTTIFTLEALNMVKAIHKRSDILLEKDISNCSWESIQVIIEIIRLLVAIIKNEPQHLTSTHWDFIFIGLFGWIETIRKSIKSDSSISILSMTSALCDLFVEVSKFMENIKADIAAGDAYKKLAEEWREVVAIEVQVRLFKIFKFTIENINESNYNNYTVTLKSLCDSSEYINGPNVIRNDTKVKWRDITCHFTELLYNSLTTQRIAATVFIQNILCPYLIEMDTNAISGESSSANNLFYQLSFELFQRTLEKTQLIVESMIQDFKLGEQICQVKPFTEAFDYTAGYLLTWSVLLKMFSNASSNLRYQYTEWFRDHDYLKILMQNILRLMPEKILDPSAQATPNLMELFEEMPKFSVTDEQTSEWVETCACGVFRDILIVAPALVRQWWSSAESRVARIVDRITSTFISSQLCTQELQNLSKHNNEHMTVKVHPTAREVVATYTVDEARMEIIISLPPNYPLGTVKIDCNNQIGATNQWRNSIMQLSLFLTHQNGNVNDGLTLWKNNLDKHFDGVEECYICFSVIHAGTYQLPKLSCSKCKKKFHSACLYKWFSTSNKSTCPICRSLF